MLLHRAVAIAVAMALALAGCRTAPHPERGAVAVPPPPAAATPAAADFTIDAAQSQVLLRVRREGPLAAMGHNHVIAVRRLRGTVSLAEPVEGSRFALQFPVGELSVDEPALRAAAGPDYRTELTEAARAGTRANMLGERLLQAADFPEIHVTSGAITPTAPGDASVELRFTVRDRTSTAPVTVHWRRDGDTLVADSDFTLLQTALGLIPFSVALGALRTADAIETHCHLVARRVQP